MTDKIVWKNYKIYNHKTIVDRIAFVESNMNGLLPLVDKEKEKLLLYTKKNNIPSYEMICLRNTIKIQKEIDRSKKIYLNIDKIKKKFIELLNDLDTSSDDQNYYKIKHFLFKTQMPVYSVLKIISLMPEFKTLGENNINHIKKIENNIHETETEIRMRSIDFEHQLENYLKSLNINFRTEIDIKRDKDYTVTPDILFDKPIIIQLDGIDYNIRWLDAKNYTLTDTPFIIKSLHKQSEKYNNIFGMGAFVFHYGFVSSIIVPNTLILDGSELNKH